MKHVTEEDLILFYYRESDAAVGIRKHLEECPSCRDEYLLLEAVLRAVSASPVPERSPSYEEEVWGRLQPGLEEISDADSRNATVDRSADFDIRRSRPRPLGFPVWMTAGAMAALLLLAFVAGRYWPTNYSQPAIVAEQAPERALLFTVGEHLERSERVLTELTNAGAATPFDMATEQRGVQELLSSNRLYRIASARAGQVALVEVLEELERTLLEISHSPSSLSQSELENLVRRIDEQGILFKIRILKSDIKQQRIAARKARQQTS